MEKSAKKVGAAAAEWAPLSALRKWAKNPRKNEGPPVAKVVESIQRFGFGAPILARAANGEIIAGHTRFEAAKRLELAQIPVRYLDLSEEEAHALALADNRIGEEAAWDKGGLADVLRSMQGEGTDLDALGFDHDELEKLLGEDMPIAIEPVEVSEVHDEFWMNVRGPLPAQREALEHLRLALASLEGVSVDVGVIER